MSAMRPSRRVVLAVALAALSTLAVACGGPGQAAQPSPVSLQNLRLIDYFPADASWTTMWGRFPVGRIAADFGTIRRLDGNAVRLTIDPYEFGWPHVGAKMAGELHTVIGLAEDHGLYVQLTLFDWFADYGDLANSVSWLKSLLAPTAATPRSLSSTCRTR